MPMNSWVDLEGSCPIEIDRIVRYSKSFNSKLPTDFSELDEAKALLLDARSDFDLMVTTLIQLLHDSEILQGPEDLHLFTKLCENLGRYLKKVDEQETILIIEEDHTDSRRNRVSVSRLASYTKLLKLSANSIIYESLLKSTKEYHNIKKTDGIEKNKRTFLYILFEVMQVTLSVLGSYTRESTSAIGKVFNNYNSGHKRMLSPKGQEIIREDMKEVVEEKGFDSITSLYEEEGDDKGDITEMD